MKPTPRPEIWNTYWRFAHERMSVFYRRLRGDTYPWSNDPILRRSKFTNCYRVLDRMSQYLVRHVINEGPQNPDDLFYRIMLAKIFNRESTFERLEQEFGTIVWDKKLHSKLDSFFTKLGKEKFKCWTSAYLMVSSYTMGYERKHSGYLEILQDMIEDDVPSRIQSAKCMGDVFEMLLGYKLIGPFTAYQYTTDLNYSGLCNFPEDTFVAPGPGSIRGIKKAFKSIPDNWSWEDVMKYTYEQQEDQFKRLGLKFPYLPNRHLMLIDAQNLYCEVDKYCRVAYPDVKSNPKKRGRTKIKHRFRPNQEEIKYVFPKSWHLKHKDLFKAAKKVPKLKFQLVPDASAA